MCLSSYAAGAHLHLLDADACRWQQIILSSNQASIMPHTLNLTLDRALQLVVHDALQLRASKLGALQYNVYSTVYAAA
jgi:hypothetical protein